MAVSPEARAWLQEAMSLSGPPPSTAGALARPTFLEAFRFWLKLGFISFGGPAGQIAMMHQELVERRRWISEGRFLHALNFCMLLPGPEAQQLATYIGWLLHGTRGGIAAGALFVLPSAILLWALSYAYVLWGAHPWMVGALYGLKPAVLAIVAAAVLRIGRKVLKNEVMIGLAGLAFLALSGVLGAPVPFPAVVIGAGLVGLLGGRVCPAKFTVLKGRAASGDDASADGAARLPIGRAARIGIIGLLLWWTPVVAVGFWQGWAQTLFRQGLFFSKAALVTFGGAYAVLPYVSQQAVGHYGWLQAGQMLDGLALAETTPGPLIMVLQFVGFVGAWQHPGGLPPLAAATLGALLTTWVTFVPCFLWIFLGAPYVERLRENQTLMAALSAITAAVVGVILNLALWFGWHVLLSAPGRFDGFAIALSAIAFVGLVRWKWEIIPLVLGSGVAGFAWREFLAG